MQTWLVHMRAPHRLKRELGWRGFAVFQLLVGGTVLAALVHALFVAELLWEWSLRIGGDIRADTSLMGLHAVTLVLGYGVSIWLGVKGLARRNLLGSAWALVLMPAYWVLLSLAAWRALIQLVLDPHRWEKTEHGLARTSRLAERASHTAAGRPSQRR